jgi:pimeloyl-ACP methyl ester carboxylesterase
VDFGPWRFKSSCPHQSFGLIMKLIYWLVDYVYMFRGHSYYLSNLLGEISWPKHHSKLPEIILIPGIYGHWSFLKPLGDLLSNAGFPVHVVPEIKRNSRPVRDGAEALNRYLRANEIRKCILIGHSKGGLVALYYKLFLDTDRRVLKVIAIASPFSGSSIGKFVRLKGVREMLPNSGLIKKLNSIKVGPDVISIYTVFDNHVWHNDLSFLKGANNIQVPVKGHHKILFDKNTQKRILELTTPKLV